MKQRSCKAIIMNLLSLRVFHFTEILLIDYYSIVITLLNSLCVATYIIDLQKLPSGFLCIHGNLDA